MRRVDANGTTHIDGRSPPRNVAGEQPAAPHKAGKAPPTRNSYAAIAILGASLVGSLMLLNSNPIASLAVSLAVIWGINIASSDKSNDQVGGLVVAFSVSAGILYVAAGMGEGQVLLSYVFLGVAVLASYRLLHRSVRRQAR